MGILDSLSSDDPQSAALRQGLLQMGLALMQGKGNVGQIIGQAGQQGVAGLQGFQDRQFQEKLREQQLADIARKKVLQGREDASYNAEEEFKKGLVSPHQQAMQKALLTNGSPTIANARNLPVPNPTQEMMYSAMKSGALSVPDYVKAQASMAKESPFAKVNPEHFTSESLAKFGATHQHEDLVPRVSADKAAQLQWEQHVWGNLSPKQKADLQLEGLNTGAKLQETQFNTGAQAPQGYAGPVLPPNQPMPNFGGMSIPGGMNLDAAGVMPGGVGSNPAVRPMPRPQVGPAQAGPGAVGSAYIAPPGARPIPQSSPAFQPLDPSTPLINQVTPKERQTLLVAKPAAESATQSILQTFDRAIDTSKELRNHKGLPAITGRLGQYQALDLAPTTLGARGLQSNLISMVGIQALNDMRAMSKTGGAVGQVTEKEWPILQQSVAALQGAQTADDYKVALRNLEAQLASSQKRVREAYESTYGALKYEKPSHITQSGPGTRSRADQIIGQ